MNQNQNAQTSYRKRGLATAEDRLFAAGWCALFVIAVLYAGKRLLFPDVVISEAMIPCALYSLTGWYCPGCGGTRSVEALFQGKFLVCAGDYPLTAYAAVMYVWFMASQSVERISRGRLKVGLRWRNAYLWIALGILAAHTVFKNVFHAVTGLEPFLS